MGSYARLSAFVAAHPEVLILRTFSKLSARNLIYLQAEIVHLEAKLERIAEQDAKLNGPESRSCANDWETLATRTGKNSLQWHTFLEIRGKLAEYCIPCPLISTYDTTL